MRFRPLRLPVSLPAMFAFGLAVTLGCAGAGTSTGGAGSSGSGTGPSTRPIESTSRLQRPASDANCFRPRAVSE